MKTVVLSGGVGGAKLVAGLNHILPPGDLCVIVNTADDFRHLGLHISPDIDTILYTLAGKANRAQGWGREGETWNFMAALRELGGEDWFRLGDHDLALHVLRTARLAAGDTLSAITAAYAAAWRIRATVLPMSDDPVSTILDTDEGTLPFQTWFVARQCAPMVRRIRFTGAESARPAPGVIAALTGADRIVLAPSNPFLSVDPVLAVPGIRRALAERRTPVVAVSPIIDGKAIKGPTAKLMAELGLPSTNDAIGKHYAGLIDGLLIHAGDAPPEGNIHIARTDTLMRDAEDRIRVARAVLALAARIEGQ